MPCLLLVLAIGIRAIVGHHLLELVKVNVAVAVGIHRFDHVVAFLLRALHSEAVQHMEELRRGDEAVLILVVKVEGLSELRGTAVLCVGAAEGGELAEVDEAVVVGVEVIHDALQLLLRNARSEAAEDVVQLAGGDLAVAVGIEAAEDSLQFFHVFQVNGGFGSFGGGVARRGCIRRHR